MEKSKELLSLLIGTEYLLEANSNEKYDIKHKVLYLISQNDFTPPSFILDRIKIARSNLAIICSTLQKDKLIEKIKDIHNKKEIYYKITTQGQALLDEKFAKTDMFLTKIRNNSRLSKLIDELNDII